MKTNADIIYESAYQMGWTDAIKEIKGKLNHRDYDFHKNGDYFTIDEVFEQLKEQKNE